MGLRGDRVADSFPDLDAAKLSPDSFADLDAKLKQMEEKTKAELAKLQADTAAPSSFVEEGSPDSFADLDAKLKQLEERRRRSWRSCRRTRRRRRASCRVIN